MRAAKDQWGGGLEADDISENWSYDNGTILTAKPLSPCDSSDSDSDSDGLPDMQILAACGIASSLKSLRTAAATEPASPSYSCGSVKTSSSSRPITSNGRVLDDDSSTGTGESEIATPRRRPQTINININYNYNYNHQHQHHQQQQQQQRKFEWINTTQIKHCLLIHDCPSDINSSVALREWLCRILSNHGLSICDFNSSQTAGISPMDMGTKRALKHLNRTVKFVVLIRTQESMDLLPEKVNSPLSGQRPAIVILHSMRYLPLIVDALSGFVQISRAQEVGMSSTCVQKIIRNSLSI